MVSDQDKSSSLKQKFLREGNTLTPNNWNKKGCLVFLGSERLRGDPALLVFRGSHLQRKKWKLEEDENDGDCCNNWNRETLRRTLSVPQTWRQNKCFAVSLWTCEGNNIRKHFTDKNLEVCYFFWFAITLTEWFCIEINKLCVVQIKTQNNERICVCSWFSVNGL